MRNKPTSSTVGGTASADGQRDSSRSVLSRRSLLMGGAGLALTAGQPLSTANAACQTQVQTRTQTPAQAVDAPPQTPTQAQAQPTTRVQVQPQTQEKGVRPQTIAEGNLYIPRAIREMHVTPPTGIIPTETALKELFRQAQVPCQLTGEYRKDRDFINFVFHGNVTFESCLLVALSNHRNCRIEKGVYIVYPLEKTNIIPGRPDLDRRWFKRKITGEPLTDAQLAEKAAHPEKHYAAYNLPKLRPALDSLFAEAGLQHQVQDDVGERFWGLDIEIDFRSAIHNVIDSVVLPATFEVRDGVYCFYPRPTY